MVFFPLLPVLFPTATALAAADFETIGRVSRLSYYVVMIVMVLLAPFARYRAAVVNAIWRFAAVVQYTSWLAAADISASEALVHFWAGFGVPGLQQFGLPSKQYINLGSISLRSPLFLHNSLYLLLPLALTASLHVFSRLYRQRNSVLWRYCYKYEVQMVTLVLGYLLAFQDLLIYALIQGRNMRFSSSIEAINAASGFIYIPLAVSVMLYLPHLFLKSRFAIVSGKVTDKSTVLAVFVDGMNSKLPIFHYFAVPVFVLQRFLVSFLYVFLTSHGKTQVLSLFLLEIAVFTYYVLTRPYQLRRSNAYVLMLQVIPCLLVLTMGVMELKVSAKSHEFLTFTYISLFCSVFPISISQFLLEFWSATRVAGSPLAEVPQCWSPRIASQLPNNTYRYMSVWETRKRLKKLAKVASSPTSESQRIKGGEGKIAFQGRAE